LIVLSAALLVFGIFFAIETAGLRQECNEKRSDVYAVASAEQTEATLAAAAGAGSEDEGWCHPNGMVVSTPPKRSTDGIWTWTDEEGVATVGMNEPKLLLRVMSLDQLRPHTEFYWVGKKSGRFSDVQTKPHDVGGYVCGGAKKKNTEEEGRFVVEGDVELAVVRRENAHARHRVGDDGVAVDRAVLPGGDTPAAAAALLAAERTVAELQAALTQLKAENEALRMQPRGAVMDLQVVAADASAARTAISDTSEASIATGVDPGAKRWFFTYKNAIELHGPFALSELQAWHAGGHFTIDQPIHLGDGSPTIELKEAFQEAAWWFVADVDGSGSVSGPHALTLLKKWQTEGRVEDDQELHLGESGKATTLLAALRAVGFGLAREEASGGREERRKQSVRAERRC
jgi:hypothetical protein